MEYEGVECVEMPDNIDPEDNCRGCVFYHYTGGECMSAHGIAQAVEMHCSTHNIVYAINEAEFAASIARWRLGLTEGDDE